MTRKSIISICAVILAALLLALLLTVTMPLWLTVCMVNPRIINPLRDKIVGKFMVESSRAMVRSMRGKKTGVM